MEGQVAGIDKQGVQYNNCGNLDVVHAAATNVSVKLLATAMDRTAISTPWLPTLTSPVK